MSDSHGDIQVDNDIEKLRTMMGLAPLDWFLPSNPHDRCCLAFHSSWLSSAFFTSEVGVSCRSLTFVVYASVEYTQIALWLWAYAGPPPPRPVPTVGRARLDFSDAMAGSISTASIGRPLSRGFSDPQPAEA